MLYSNSKRVDAERMSSEIISLKDRVLEDQQKVQGTDRKKPVCHPLPKKMRS